MAYSMKYYVHWSFSPLVGLFAIPMILASVLCILGLFCRVKCIDMLIYGIVSKIVRVSPKKLNKHSEEKHNTLYGYRVTRWGMYYFFYFIVYIFSASVALLWSKFLLRESFECKPGEKGQDCFTISDEKPIDCPFLSTEAAVTVSDANIVCFKFIYAYGKAFTSAAGLFAGCITAFYGIIFVVILFSTFVIASTKHCAAKCCIAKYFVKKKLCFTGLIISYPKICLIIFTAIQLIIVLVVLAKYSITANFLLHNRFKLESSELVNLSFVTITVCYASLFPWWAFQRANGDQIHDNSNSSIDIDDVIEQSTRKDVADNRNSAKIICCSYWSESMKYWSETMNKY